MRANGLEHSVSSGGTGTLTLAAVSGKPSYADAFGSSGVRMVKYQFLDGDSYEIGIGSINLATMVLTRIVVRETWNGSVKDDIEPTALNISTSATCICGPTYEDILPAINGQPYTSWAGGSDLVFPPSNATDGAYGSHSCVANQIHWTPFWWQHSFLIKQAAIEVTTFGTSAHARVGLHEVDWDPTNGGKPGRLICDFGEFDASANGIVINSPAAWTTSLPSLFLPPGWYWAAVSADVNHTIRGYNDGIPSMMTIASGRQGRWFSRSSAYAPFLSHGYNEGTGSWGGPINNTGSPLLMLGP